MKFSDPFGRMERRHQAGYEAMREALQKAGVNTPSKAREIISQSRERAVKFLVLALSVLLLLIFLFPSGMPLLSVIAVFLSVWVITSTFNGRRYILRYITDDLKQDDLV